MKLARTISIAAALTMSSAALAEESGWSISEADGQVSVTRDSKAIYGAAGTRLQVGDVIRTTKASRAVLVRGEEFVIVSPNEQIRIVRKEESGAVSQALQFLGEMFSSNDQKSDFKRPPQAAVVKGYGSGVEKGED